MSVAMDILIGRNELRSLAEDELEATLDCFANFLDELSGSYGTLEWAEAFHAMALGGVLS